MARFPKQPKKQEDPQNVAAAMDLEISELDNPMNIDISDNEDCSMDCEP